MQTTLTANDQSRYARCIEVSKRVRWDIEKDVIRGRRFNRAAKFLPDGLSLVNELEFLSDGEQRLLSQVQGRTYAYIFGLVERFISAKITELSGSHALGDQIAYEALVRFTDEEIKHQILFRAVEEMIDDVMPPGYRQTADANAVAKAVLSKSAWSVLALTCHIELFTQAHYRQSIEPDERLSDLYRDIFLFHWREESQHAILDELEWKREHERLSPAERDAAVNDLIELVAAVDGIIQQQAVSDVEYFASICERELDGEELGRLREGVLKAYRWQYIFSGVEHPRFLELLQSMTTEEQMERISRALNGLCH